MTLSLMSAAEPASRRSVLTKLFGPVDYSEHQVVSFAKGLLGFPSCHAWLLMDGAKPGTAWLQSTEHGALAFLLVDPFMTFEGFTADLAPADVRRLDARDPADLAVFAIVTLPAGRGDEATANLQGPIVINVQARCGAQVVLSEGRWDLREPIPGTLLG